MCFYFPHVFGRIQQRPDRQGARLDRMCIAQEGSSVCANFICFSWLNSTFVGQTPLCFTNSVVKSWYFRVAPTFKGKHGTTLPLYRPIFHPNISRVSPGAKITISPVKIPIQNPFVPVRSCAIHLYPLVIDHVLEIRKRWFSIPYMIAWFSHHYSQTYLVGGLEHFLFFHIILGMSSSQLTFHHVSEG